MSGVDALRRAVDAAEERLERAVTAMTDDQAAAPSRLPGWTRAEVVTHLARNADSNARAIRSALRGDSQPQYPGGPPQRAADIAAGRGRPARDLLDDLRAAAAELAEAFDAADPHGWDVMVRAGVGDRPVHNRLRTRRLEVEVHLVDLDLGYEIDDWPEDFVRAELDRTIDAMPRRRTQDALKGRWRVGTRVLDVDVGHDSDVDGWVDGEPRHLLAWLIGRSGPERLRYGGRGDVLALPRWFPHP